MQSLTTRSTSTNSQRIRHEIHTKRHSGVRCRRGKGQLLSSRASVLDTSHSIATDLTLPHSSAKTLFKSNGTLELPKEAVRDEFQFNSIEAAIEEIAAGRFVVVLDDESRENEGDLIAAAELVTTESIAFMVEHTSGVICIGMKGEELDRLQLPLMVPPLQNTDAKCTAFTVTVDLKNGTTTGISASDRAKTLRALAAPTTQSSDLRRPGHIFPLRYEEGGVLSRRGHTEASVDLAQLAGCQSAGVLCEIVNRIDGSMARTPQLFDFAREHGLCIITIEDLAEYLQTHPTL